MNKSIIFRVDGDFGNKSGSGHIWRCLKIYKFFKKKFKRRYNYIFLTRKNYGSVFLKSQTGEKIIYYSEKSKNFPIKQTDIVIIDTLGVDNNLLNFLKKKKLSKIISFDEINIKKFSEATIINGIYFTRKKLFSKSKKVKVFQGLKYILLDKDFSRKKKLFNKRKKTTILITSGGSDKKKFAVKIASALKNQKNLKIKLILGKGVSHSDSVNNLKKFKNIHLIKNEKNLFNQFNSSNIAFVSGGTVMFEAISLGLVPFVAKTYASQKYAIKFFKDRNLINYIGDLNKLNKNYLGKIIKDIDFKSIRFRKRNSIIDGKGFLRVVNIIEKILIN